MDFEQHTGVGVRSVSELKIKLFADGADRTMISQACSNPLISGFTTNPTLMHSAGVRDYESFAREILGLVGSRPISIGVIADELSEIERQSYTVASWGQNVYVKIPVTNTRRHSTMDLVSRLADSGVKVNVTAVFTLEQVQQAAEALGGGPPAVISVFAGRIADTGRDPVPIMAEAVKIVSKYQNIELLWASPRELLNIFQANDVGCHIITATDNILAKLSAVGKDLCEYSLETVQMFHNDATRSGYELK